MKIRLPLIFQRLPLCNATLPRFPSYTQTMGSTFHFTNFICTTNIPGRTGLLLPMRWRTGRAFYAIKGKTRLIASTLSGLNSPKPFNVYENKVTSTI